MNCNIEITLGNKPTVTVNSDKELDQYLTDHAQSLENWYLKTDGKLDKMFQELTPQEETMQKLSEMEREINKLVRKYGKKKVSETTEIIDDESAERLDFGNIAIGVTKVLELIGNKKDLEKEAISGMNTFWENSFRLKMSRIYGLDMNSAEVTSMWEKELAKGKLSAKLGEDVHYILQVLFNQVANPELTIDPNKCKYLKGASFNAALKMLTEFADSIKKKHPGAIFKTEFPIISKPLDNSVKTALAAKNKPGKEYVNGYIDLLVIDKDGKAIIYDWKTSQRPVGDWGEQRNTIITERGWLSSAAKNKANYQVGSYGAILSQWGLEVGDKNIERFVMDYKIDKQDDKYTITEVESIKHDLPTSKPGLQQVIADSAQHTFGYMYNTNKPIEIDKLVNTDDIMRIIAPGLDTESNSGRQRIASIEEYKNKPNFVHDITDKESDLYKNGKRFFFYRDGVQDSRRVNCTPEELDEQLGKYVADLEKYRANELDYFAENLQRVFNTRGQDTNVMEKWYHNFNDSSRVFLRNIFEKYYKTGWNFVKNKELNQNGILIFNKSNQMEIVSISSKDLFYVNQINGNQNICGAKMKDFAQGTDNYNVLNASNGNLALMRVAALISSNPEILSGCKINSVRVINPWTQKECDTHSNKTFVDNWNLIYRKNRNEKGAKFRTLNPEWFFSDPDSYINTAMDLCASENLDIFNGALRPNRNEAEYTEEKITQFMDKMESTYKDSCFDIETKEGLIYYNLGQARLAIATGLHIYIEPDTGKFVSKGAIPNGTYIAPNDQSISANVRAVNTLFNRCRDKYTDYFTQTAKDFQKITERVFKAWGFNQVTDSPTKFWRQFFELDKNGNVTKQFRLKRPEDSYFTKGRTKEQTESARDFIEYIAAYFNESKGIKYSNEQLERARDNGSYFEVPLMKAEFGQAVRDTFEKSGVKAVVNNMWKNIKNAVRPLAEEVVLGGRKQQRTWQRKSSDLNGAYNPFNISSHERDVLLSKEGNVFSTDLQTVFLEVAASTSVSQASKEFIPYFIAFKSGLEYASKFGLDVREIREWLQDYTDAKLLRKQITAQSLDFIKDILSAMKSITSKVTLGFNTRTGVKEMISSAYRAYTRAGTKLLQGVTLEELTEAVGIVASKKPLSFSTKNFVAFLNSRFALSSFSAQEMAETSKIRNYGLRQFGNKDSFIMSKLPDDYFRVAVAIAKLKHDGAFNAYEEVKGGFVYNIKKDKRFDKLFKSDGTMITAEEATDLKEWKKQKDKYDDYYTQWARAGKEIKYGDSFPDAYPPDEKASIRNAAKNLYGEFDSEDKSLFSYQVLGSSLMQYKSFLGAVLNQHLKTKGFENQWVEYIETDENGEEIWEVASTPEEIAAGMDAIQFVPKSEVTDQEIRDGRARALRIKEGTYSVGMLPATWGFLTKICTLDTEGFRELWNNPIDRGQLLNGLMDTLGLMLFLALLKITYGEDVITNKADQDWWTQWSYGVLTGFAEDGPINMVLGSVVQGIIPPAFQSVKQWAQTAHGVLTGDRELSQAIITTFGATRELSSYFN